jgi:hypothetical protein
MNGYRDELEALRLRAQSLEATLREREASLQARDAQLREAEARAERNLRGGGQSSPRPPGFDDSPVAPKRTSAVMVLVVAVMALVTVASIVAVFSLRSANAEANAQHTRELAAVQELAKREAERGTEAEKARKTCEAQLSGSEDRITKLKLEAELDEARKAASIPSK